MNGIRTMVAVAALAGAAFASPAQANPVCVTDPTVALVYTGCTKVVYDGQTLCVTGGGEIAGRPYRLGPCPA